MLGAKKLQDLETKTDENNRKKGQQRGKKKRESKIIVVLLPHKAQPHLSLPHPHPHPIRSAVRPDNFFFSVNKIFQHLLNSMSETLGYLTLPLTRVRRRTSSAAVPSLLSSRKTLEPFALRTCRLEPSACIFDFPSRILGPRPLVLPPFT